MPKCGDFLRDMFDPYITLDSGHVDVVCLKLKGESCTLRTCQMFDVTKLFTQQTAHEKNVNSVRNVINLTLHYKPKTNFRFIVIYHLYLFLSRKAK